MLYLVGFPHIIACYIKIAALALKPDDHYGNVIRLEKLRTDMEFTRLEPELTWVKYILSGLKNYPENMIRTENAFYR